MRSTEGRGPRFVCLAFAFVVGCAPRAPSCVTGDLTKMPDGRVVESFAPWSHDAKVCRVGGYVVVGPAGRSDGSLWIERDGKPFVMIQEGTEVDVFSNQHDQGGARPVLTLQDRDGDGSFDFLSYETRDGHGDPAGEVTDGDLDGEADFKVLPGGTGALARIGGQWCPLQKQGDRQGALIDGKWRPVRREGWRWILIE